MLKKYILALLLIFGFAGLTACSSGSSNGETEIVDMSEGIDQALDEELLDEELVSDFGEDDLGADDLLNSSFDTDIVEETIEDSIPDIEMPEDAVADAGSDIFDNPDIFSDDIAAVTDEYVTEEIVTSPPEYNTAETSDLFEDNSSIVSSNEYDDAQLFEDTSSNISTNSFNDSDLFEDASPGGAAAAPMYTSNMIDGGAATYVEDGGSAFFEDSGNRSWVPVRKMASAPFYKNGILANALYVVRDGDTINSISQKIFGMDKSTELLQVNTTLGNGVKVGDKVYYNSPQRTNDDSRMQTFYEDMGMAAEFYVSSRGENIRAASEKLLGNSNSWKEVWATNPDVESKWEIPEGTTLRYWAGSSNMAAMTPPPQPAAPEPPPRPMIDKVADSARAATDTIKDSVADMRDDIMPPPEEPMDVADNDEVPPPPSFGSVESTPPPPPAPPGTNRANRNNKTADAPAAVNKRKVAKASSKNQTMAIGAVGILLLGAAMLIFLIRRRRKSDVSYATQTHTHIE